MFKVSFKGDFKKFQTFNERCTKVTMVGQMSFPTHVWTAFPNKVADWMWQHPSVDASWGNCTRENEVIRLEFSGKSICAEGDAFDPIIGERIAEARAKIKLYRFMFTLCDMLIKYHLRLIYGDAKIQIFISKDSTISCISDAWNKYRELVIKESHHLGKLLEEA